MGRRRTIGTDKLNETIKNVLVADDEATDFCNKRGSARVGRTEPTIDLLRAWITSRLGNNSVKLGYNHDNNEGIRLVEMAAEIGGHLRVK